MIEIVDGVVKGNPSVSEIEEFFINHENADYYYGQFYDDEIIDYDSDNLIEDACVTVLTMFGLNYFGNGCSRVVVNFGNYVAKIMFQQDEFELSNNKELELWNLVKERDKSLLHYLVPIVGSVDSGYGDNLVVIQPRTQRQDVDGINTSVDFLELGETITDKFKQIGILLEDIDSAKNYGFFDGQWRIIDYGNWKSIE